MDWKNQLTGTPYLVLFIVLITIGIGTASALITITLAGNVNITGDTDIDGSLNVDGTITGVETLEGLNCSSDQIARFDGNNWVCNELSVRINPTSIVDLPGDVGTHTSIAIDNQGIAMISYIDKENGNLKFARCGNIACTTGNTITTVDNTISIFGGFTSIVIKDNGIPVISYYDSSNDDLKVVRCGNIFCNTGNIITAKDSALTVGEYTSIAIGLDGDPVISYYDLGSDDLKVIKCSLESCAPSNDKITTIDSGVLVGKHTSIAIGTDGIPVISYYDENNGNLKFARCGNTACTTGNTITTVDSATSVGRYTSIAIGTDGKPVISYLNDDIGNLKFLKCDNTSCTTRTITTVDDSIGVGGYTSIAIGIDGNPVISYYDFTNKDLKFVKCGNTSCTDGNTITSPDTAGDVGKHTSIAIGVDGNPIISYFDESGDNLKTIIMGTIFD